MTLGLFSTIFFFFVLTLKWKSIFLQHFGPLTHSKNATPELSIHNYSLSDRYSERGGYGQERGGGWERDGRQSLSGGGNYSARDSSGVEQGWCSPLEKINLFK
jgi:hypothetical protein